MTAYNGMWVRKQKIAEDSIARRDMLSKNKDMKYLYFCMLIGTFYVS
jgi:hypothetical protein